MHQLHRIVFVGIIVIAVGMSLAAVADNGMNRMPPPNPIPAAAAPPGAMAPLPTDNPAALRIALLTKSQVQGELKMKMEERADLWSVIDKYRSQSNAVVRSRDLKKDEREKQLNDLRVQEAAEMTKLLKPEQVKRLSEIEYQVRGVPAIGDVDVATILGLTQETFDKVRAAIADGKKAEAAYYKSVSPEGMLYASRTIEAKKIKSDTEKAVMDLLTDVQKKKWTEMLGAPFKLVYSPNDDNEVMIPKLTGEPPPKKTQH